MTDDNPHLIIEWQPAGRAARRAVFHKREHAADGGPAFERVEQARRDSGTWRTVGTEYVDGVNVEDRR